jgi:hypothetical protein
VNQESLEEPHERKPEPAEQLLEGLSELRLREELLSCTAEIREFAVRLTRYADALKDYAADYIHPISIEKIQDRTSTLKELDASWSKYDEDVGEDTLWHYISDVANREITPAQRRKGHAGIIEILRDVPPARPIVP